MSHIVVFPANALYFPSMLQISLALVFNYITQKIVLGSTWGLFGKSRERILKLKCIQVDRKILPFHRHHIKILLNLILTYTNCISFRKAFAP